MDRDEVRTRPPKRMATKQEMTSLDWVIRQAAHSDARQLEAQIEAAKLRGESLVETIANCAAGRR